MILVLEKTGTCPLTSLEQDQILEVSRVPSEGFYTLLLFLIYVPGVESIHQQLR